MARTRNVQLPSDDGDAYIPPPIEDVSPPPPPKKPRRKKEPPAVAPIAPEPVPVPEPEPVPPPVFVPPPPPPFTPSDARLLKAVVAELSQRNIEALRLYRPLPKLAAFHETNVHTRIVLGSNRAGKTLISAVEVARAVTGQDPFDKYPKENGIWFVFGNDEAHLGSVCYAELFRAGAFQIIRDELTGEWRVFDQIRDAARKKEAKPAPPLIPNRFVKHTTWTDKGGHIPKKITLHNGWEIHFFSGSGAAIIPQGQKINGWWVDEEVKRKGLIEEIHARCLDCAGIGFWSCTPQASTAQLYDLHDRAQKGDPAVEEFFAKLSDNPFISDEEKLKFYNALSEEARRVRFHGEFALSKLSVYPEFSVAIHSWNEKAQPISDRWGRWLIVDPGRQRCAVLFGAVSPPKEIRLPCVVAYDELYIEACTAKEMARQVALKSRGIVYEGGVIDMRAARVHEMGAGRTIKDHYERALEQEGVEFRGGGRPNFIWGCDDVEAGIERVKEWLRVRQSGQPYFFIVPERLRWFQWEIERYRNAVDPQTGMPIDKPVQKNNHLVDTLRYFAMLDPEWVEPDKPKRRRNSVLERLRKKQEKDRQDAVVRLA